VGGTVWQPSCAREDGPEAPPAAAWTCSRALPAAVARACFPDRRGMSADMYIGIGTLIIIIILLIILL
jgi:hypothetical protein